MSIIHLILALALTLGLGVHLDELLNQEPIKTARDQPVDLRPSSLPSQALVRLGLKKRFNNSLSLISVTFLPDGRTVATTAPDGDLIFWDARTGTELRRLTNHPIVVFAPNGKIIATRKAPNENVIRLLDVKTGKEIGRASNEVTPKSPNVFGRDFYFSPDQRLLAVGGGTQDYRDDGPPLRLWELSTGKVLLQVPVRQRLQSLAFSPDSKIFATVAAYQRQGNPVQLWEVASANKLRDLEGDASEISVAAIRFSPDGNSLAAACYGPVVVLWDVHTGKQRWQLPLMEKRTGSALSFSPDGRTMAVATFSNMGPDGDASVYLLESGTGRVRCRFQGHVGSVQSVAFSPDGFLLASAGDDGAPIIWDVTGRFLSGNQTVKLLMAKELDCVWSDLASEDAAKAWQAICALSVRPEQAISFLKRRLPANPPLNPKQLTGLLADLDSDDFDVREQAAKELVVMGHAVAPAVRKLHVSTKSPEVRIRTEAVLVKLIKAGIFAEELRCARAIEVLEYAATPEAEKLLEEESKGAAESLLTQEAKSAIDRLAKRRPAKP